MLLRQADTNPCCLGCLRRAGEGRVFKPRIRPDRVLPGPPAVPNDAPHKGPAGVPARPRRPREAGPRRQTWPGRVSAPAQREHSRPGRPVGTTGDGSGHPSNRSRSGGRPPGPPIDLRGPVRRTLSTHSANPIQVTGKVGRRVSAPRGRSWPPPGRGRPPSRCSTGSSMARVLHPTSSMTTRSGMPARIRSLLRQVPNDSHGHPAFATTSATGYSNDRSPGHAVGALPPPGSVQMPAS